MTGNPTEQGENWDRFREFLSLLARVQCGARWKGKLDLSGIVQQTLLEAFRAGEKLADATEAQKAAWLKQGWRNRGADEGGKLTGARRDAGRERSLEAQMAESMSRLERFLPAEQSSPSAQAVREERMIAVARALAALPANQRQAIELHYLDEKPLAEVAELLHTTRPAVAGLLHRGLKKLKELLTRESAGA